MLAAHAGFRGLVGMFGGGSGEAEKTWGNSRSRTIPLSPSRSGKPNSMRIVRMVPYEAQTII